MTTGRRAHARDPVASPAQGTPSARAKYPQSPGSMALDAHGSIDRSTFVVEITNGARRVVGTIPPLNPGALTGGGS